MSAFEWLGGNAPDTTFVASERMQTVATDSLQDLKRTVAQFIRSMFVAPGIKGFLVSTKRDDAPFGGFMQWFALLLEPVTRGLGEEEEVLEINRESVAGTGGKSVGFVPDDDIATNPAALIHFQRETEWDQAKGLFRNMARSWLERSLGPEKAATPFSKPVWNRGA